MSTPPDVPPDDSAPRQPAPGWYDDPAAPGRPRWWDGEHWAPPSAAPPANLQQPGAAAPGPGGQAPGWPGPAGKPPVDIDQELRSGRRARAFLILGIVSHCLSPVLTVIVLDAIMDYVFDVFDAASRNQPIPEEPVMSGAAQTANMLINLTSLGSLVAGIVFMVWLYRAMLNARDLGLPARLSPLWGVLGFILPIINFWFPYWCAADLFPPGDERRRLVLRWWLTWIGAQLLVALAVIAVFVSFPAGIALALVCAALYVISGILARIVIHAAGETHARMAQHAGSALPAYQSGGPAMPAEPPLQTPDPWAKAAERRDDPWSNP